MARKASAQERSTHARMAAHALHAQYDSRELTAPARAASPSSLSYWESKVDPDGLLAEGERARRAEQRRKQHFQSLNLKSQQARRRAAS